MAEAALSDLAVYVAKPVIEVDGDTNDMVSELLIGMEMSEAEGEFVSMQLRFANVASEPRGEAGLAFDDEAVLRLGANVTVFGGDENAPTELFRGIVTGLEGDYPEEGPPELLLLAEDAGQRGRMVRRTQVHDSTSVADLAQQIAQRLSLRPTVSGFQSSIGTRVQLNESDYGFMHRMLRRYDGDVQVVGDELHVAPREDIRRGTLELALHSQLRSARFLADLAHQLTEVTVGGWDSVQGQRVGGSSDGASLGPGSGRTGAQILEREIGNRRAHVGGAAVTTDAEAQALAHAMFDRFARGFVRVEATAEGNPTLRVGTHVTLTGVSPRFENTYYVTRTCHRYDVERGYETDFEAESAFLGVP